MNIAEYQAKQYPFPPCWELVSDVYSTELGKTVTEYRTITSSIRAISSAFRIAIHKGQHGFRQIAEPADFCIVLLGASTSLGPHHCGVYYEGSVLHAKADITLYQDLASLRSEYTLMEFWSRA